jgi:hypothetical protein
VAAPPEHAAVRYEDGVLVACRGVDPAVIAQLWRSRGSALCAELDGSFTFALFDERGGEALLAVDRLASRPLVYQDLGNGVLFASSADALLRHPRAARAMSAQAIYEYLYFGFVPAGRALYHQQQRLGPGDYLYYRAGVAERRCAHPAAAPLVTPALLTQSAPPADVAALVQRVAHLLDQPCGRPLLAVFDAEARRAATSGAADISFALPLDAGLADIQQAYRRYERLPAPLRQLAIEPLLFQVLRGLRTPGLNRLRARIARSVQSLPARLDADGLLGRYGGVEHVLDPELRVQVDVHGPLRLMQDAYWASYGRPAHERLAMLELRFGVSGGALPALMTVCDAAGIEPLLPGLDGPTLQAVRGPQPSAAAWMDGDARLRELAFDSLIDLKRRHLVHGALLDALLTGNPAEHADIVWPLMMLEQWLAARSPVRAPERELEFSGG